MQPRGNPQDTNVFQRIAAAYHKTFVREDAALIDLDPQLLKPLSLLSKEDYDLFSLLIELGGPKEGEPSAPAPIAVGACPAEPPSTDTFATPDSKFQSAFPDELIGHFVSRCGFATADVRVLRLISLAAQKHVTDIIATAQEVHRLRQPALSSSTLPVAPVAGTKRQRPATDLHVVDDPNFMADAEDAGDAEAALTLADVNAALEAQGLDTVGVYFPA
jgi:hypothetical protein